MTSTTPDTTSTFAPGPRPPAVEGRFALDAFEFESGGSLSQLHIGYVMYGTLNAARDNLLLVLPGTGNVRHSVIEHVGPGRAYDTDRYCVVCTDAIGGGTSSNPADGLRRDFPQYTIRDMVRAQHRFVRDGLGLRDQPVAVLAGASMGAFQTLEWLVNFPGSVDAAVLLVPGWRAGNVLSLTAERMTEIVALDPRWCDGDYSEQPIAGLRAAGQHYFPWTVSDQYLSDTEFDQLRAEARATGEWFGQWDALNLVRRYQTSAKHDVSAPFGGRLDEALSRVDARALVMPCAQDRLLGLEGARQIADGIANSEYCEIDSTKGHVAWRAVPGSPQTIAVTDGIRRFLDLAPAPRSAATPSGARIGEG